MIQKVQNIQTSPQCKNILELNLNRSSQQTQCKKKYLTIAPQKDTVSFTGARQTKAGEKFVGLLYKNILKELGFKNGPKLSIGALRLGSACFFPTKGEIKLNEKFIHKKATTLGNFVRHELKHFEQISLIAQLPNGISRLEKALVAMEEKSKSSKETLKKRSILNVFLFKNTKKEAELNKPLSKTFNRENFRTFYEKVVEEKGILKPDSPEAIRAEKYLKALGEYPSIKKSSKRFKNYDSFWGGIKEKVKIIFAYMTNPLEREAYLTGDAFEKNNKTQLLQVRKACENNSYNPEKLGLKVD